MELRGGQEGKVNPLVWLPDTAVWEFLEHLKEREFRTWKFLACTGLCLKVFGFCIWCRSIFRGIWVSFCAFKHNSWGFMTGFLILMSLSSGGSLEECSDLLIWWCHGKALHDEPSLSLSNSHFSEAFLVVNY